MRIPLVTRATYKYKVRRPESGYAAGSHRRRRRRRRRRRCRRRRRRRADVTGRNGADVTSPGTPTTLRNVSP